MRRLIWGAVAGLVLAGAVVWAARAIEEARKPELATLLPDGALLYLEAKDFGSLLKDWPASDAMRTWLASDNHEAFSRSRLFTRLSQAQQEFSAAAGIPTDDGLLAKVAGKESCLGLYDIGNLEFVYVTKLYQSDLDGTQLWYTRGKFEQRAKCGAQTYIRPDSSAPPLLPPRLVGLFWVREKTWLRMRSPVCRARRPAACPTKPGMWTR
jgi:hypothetical protein